MVGSSYFPMALTILTMYLCVCVFALNITVC